MKRLLLATFLLIPLSGCSLYRNAVNQATKTEEIRYIPSGSMLPILQKNDRVKVNKIAYLKSSPQRGDIVLYKSPHSFDNTLISFRKTPLPSAAECYVEKNDLACQHYIKRVVAIGGDQIVVSEKGELFLNGSLVNEKYVSKYCLPSSPMCEKVSTVVPKGHVFVLGDNRPNSWDSRYWPNHFLPLSKISGKVESIVWPIERSGLIKEN